MPIVQVPLDIPDDIYDEVLKGSFELLGMVKDKKNRVRKHIPRAKISKAESSAKVKNNGIWQIIKENKKIFIGVGAVAVVAGTGSYIFSSWKSKRKEEAEERTSKFKKALKNYIKATKKGKLNAKVVDELLFELNELEMKKIGKDIELTISASQLTTLIFSIFTYTEKLAEANSYTVEILKPKKGTKGNIVSLKSYLEIQKEILECSA